MRKWDHHITIKNYRTGVREGFLLASWDAPYTVQWVDNIAQRVQDWEILYSDFTSSRVFAQSDWSEWISKYWDPELSGYYIFPSKKYKHKKNILIWEGEFTLWGAINNRFNLTGVDPRGPMCAGEEAWVVYLWNWMTIYRSTDYGVNFALWKDFSTNPRLSEVNEITDIIYVAPKDLVYTHPSPMWGGTCSWIQELFVCFYNRSTKKSAVARYDIDFLIRAASGNTYLSGWGGNINVAYWSKRESIDLQTSSISNSTTISVVKYSGTTCWIPANNWKDIGFFPWQKLKLTRTFNWAVYNLSVSSIWDVGWIGDLVISWLPWFSWVSPENNYTAEISRTADTICVPCTTIAVYTNVWYWLWQNIVINGIEFNIYWIGNGRTSFGNLPSFFPGGGTDTKEYVMLKRNDGGSAWDWVYWNGVLNVFTEKWIYHTWIYNNIVTKLVHVKWSRSHIWGFNKISPTNKLYDVGYGEITSNAGLSNIYANSLNWFIHSAQNHTITFNDGSSPVSGIWASDYVMYIGTQNGTGEEGTQSNLMKFTLNSNQTAPVNSTVALVGEQAIGAMAYVWTILYLGTNKKWYIYEWNDAQNLLTQIAKLPVVESTNTAYIDAMEIYAGKVVISYQKWGWVYQIDPYSRQNQKPLIEADVLCSSDESNARIHSIINTWGSLLFSAGTHVYSYSENWIAEDGFMESSIYGWYISNVDKLWIYWYVRVNKWQVDSGRVALEVSFDWGSTWQFCPTEKNKPFVQTLNWADPIYSVGFNEQDNEQLIFLFPYNTKSWTITYRVHLQKAIDTDNKTIVNHVSIHFNLNYKQELLFNYQIDLNKSSELLTGREVEVDRQVDKLLFLKEIWQNQDMVELTDVTWKVYTCIPYSDEKTTWQWLIISTSNSNTAHKDLDNLVFKVVFWLKTVANYDKIL